MNRWYISDVRSWWGRPWRSSVKTCSAAVSGRSHRLSHPWAPGEVTDCQGESSNFHRSSQIFTDVHLLKQFDSHLWIQTMPDPLRCQATPGGPVEEVSWKICLFRNALVCPDAKFPAGNLSSIPRCLDRHFDDIQGSRGCWRRQGQHFHGMSLEQKDSCSWALESIGILQNLTEKHRKTQCLVTSPSRFTKCHEAYGTRRHSLTHGFAEPRSWEHHGGSQWHQAQVPSALPAYRLITYYSIAFYAIQQYSKIHCIQSLFMLFQDDHIIWFKISGESFQSMKQPTTIPEFRNCSLSFHSFTTETRRHNGVLLGILLHSATLQLQPIFVLLIADISLITVITWLIISLIFVADSPLASKAAAAKEHLAKAEQAQQRRPWGSYGIARSGSTSKTHIVI